MKVCNCALPALTGNNNCCKSCGNQIEFEDLNWNPFPWIKDGKLLRIKTSTSTAE